MSKFLLDKFQTLTPYVPGEQPKIKNLIKLNTNESPFPPSPAVLKAISEESKKLNLYGDPTASKIVNLASEFFGVKPENIIFSNGSDEILYLAFLAYTSKDKPIVFPEFTYGFYEVFADMLNSSYSKIPLNDDFSINVNDYIGVNKNIIIANPNAPTGLTISNKDIEKIASSNPNNVVIIDEAYVDFGGNSAIELTKKYENLLITRTFSKSASLAGLRLGFAIGNANLIKDLNALRFSINPYNVNSLALIAGEETIKDYKYYLNNSKTIIETREYLTAKLNEMGFKVIPSKANFVFASYPSFTAEELYNKLKNYGVYVRYWNKQKIKNYVRISIGSKEDINGLITALEKIIEGTK